MPEFFFIFPNILHFIDDGQFNLKFVLIAEEYRMSFLYLAKIMCIRGNPIIFKVWTLPRINVVQRRETAKELGRDSRPFRFKRLEGCVEIFEGSVRTYRLTPSDAHARSFFRDPSSRPPSRRVRPMRACETTRTR